MYECFLIDTLDLVRHVPAIDPLGPRIFHRNSGRTLRRWRPTSGCCSRKASVWVNASITRLTGCLSPRGYERVVIMNSDGPTLPASHLAQAASSTPCPTARMSALGPSANGGYYLIGVRRPAPRLLREVRMSTSTVLADTLALAAEEGLRVELLPAWYDVDEAADLARLAGELADAPPDVAPHTRAFLTHRRVER